MNDESTSVYHQNFPLENLTREQFLVLAVETSKALDWELYVNDLEYSIFPNKNDETNTITVNFEDNNAIFKAPSNSTNSAIENIQIFITKILQLKDSLSEEEYLQKHKEIQANIKANQQEDTEDFSWLDMLKPSSEFFFTAIIIIINLLVFVVMVFDGANIFSPTNEQLLKWGANYRSYTINGDWWRMITANFVHIGVFHLLLNLFAFFFISVFVEAVLGKIRYITAFLIVCIAVSLNSLWWNNNTVSAGASGAIFGLYGIFLVLLSTNLVDKETRKSLMPSILIFIALNLFAGIEDGVDNAAHLGGLLSGIPIGIAFFFSLRKPDSSVLKYSMILLCIIMLRFTSNYIFKKLHHDIDEYERLYQIFYDQEIKALEFYKLPENSSKEDYHKALHQNGILLWKENKKITDTIARLNIPDYILEQNKLFQDYCLLRIKSYHFMDIELQAKNDISYRDSIAFYDNKIDSIIMKIKTLDE